MRRLFSGKRDSDVGLAWVHVAYMWIYESHDILFEKRIYDLSHDPFRNH